MLGAGSGCIAVLSSGHEGVLGPVQEVHIESSHQVHLGLQIFKSAAKSSAKKERQPCPHFGHMGMKNEPHSVWENIEQLHRNILLVDGVDQSLGVKSSREITGGLTIDLWFK